MENKSFTDKLNSIDEKEKQRKEKESQRKAQADLRKEAMQASTDANKAIDDYKMYKKTLAGKSESELTEDEKAMLNSKRQNAEQLSIKADEICNKLKSLYDTPDKNVKNTDKNVKNTSLSNNFYNALSSTTNNGFANKSFTGANSYDVQASGASDRAGIYDNQKAKAEGQDSWYTQRANTDPGAEAGQIAETQNAAVNKQNIEQNRNKTGKSIGRLRTTTTPDVMTQKQFGAQMMEGAKERSDTAAKREVLASTQAETAEDAKVASKEFNTNTSESNRLSKGTDKNVDNKDNKTSNTDSTSDTEISDEPGSAPENKPDNSGLTFRQAIARVFGFKDENDPGVDVIIDNTDKEKAQQYLDKFEAWLDNSPEYNRNGINTQKWLTAQKNLVSDANLKDVYITDKLLRELSDLRMKFIKEDYDTDGCCSPEDFIWLAEQQGGKYNHDGRDYDFFNDDDWNDDSDDSVLNGYAEHIRNFLYTYKPEATDIDPEIDPNEEHIGPMAQDIEKVNPACIKETPEGVKTVDTGRLAMMNAGAIGDIARQLRELTERLSILESSYES